MKTIRYAAALLLSAMMQGTWGYTSAQTYVEDDGYVSSGSEPYISGMKTVREISGGTVFRISYSGAWSPEMKGAFEYAARMVEEVIPPCLPITVEARVIPGGASSALTKVSWGCRDNFGSIYENERSPMTEIKAVVLGEYVIGAVRQFADNITEDNFFDNPLKPDIIVSFNGARLGEFSFAIDSRAHDRYDFVTIASRELLRGMGMTSSIKAAVGKIIYPAGCVSPFESHVLSCLGQEDAAAAYRNATSGSLYFYGTDDGNDLNLYAPRQWSNGVSLNYFIPDDRLNMSRIMSAGIGKGTVIRDISDPTFREIFDNVLRWKIFGVSSTSAISSTHTGSTGNLIPYGGTVNFGQNDSESYATEIPGYPDLVNQTTPEDAKIPAWVANNIVPEACMPYHPYYTGDNGIGVDAGWTVSALKKDGTWDCLYRTAYDTDDFSVDFNQLEFHCGNSEYARTCDGYLRIRLTKASWTMAVGASPSLGFHSYYYVMDYLPQQVSVGLAANQPTQSSASGSKTVALGLRGLEGATSVTIEQKRQGARVPNYIVVDDVKSGSVTVTAATGVRTTFTAVSSNANGTVRGEPFTLDLTAQ